MFPIRDDNPQINIPYATYLLIALNVLSWLLLQGFGVGPELASSVCEYGLIPADLFNHSVPVSVTEIDERYCAETSDWRGLFSSMFMHGGWLHIIGNMWFLWIFGDNVEDAMGSIRFLIFYLLCGLAAAGAQVLAGPSSTVPMVGASGAIGGVMGAYIMLYPKVKVQMAIVLGFIFTTISVPAVTMLGYWAFFQLIGGIASIGASGGGIAFWAHIGGFVAGVVLVNVFKDEALLKKHPYHGW